MWLVFAMLALAAIYGRGFEAVRSERPTPQTEADSGATALSQDPDPCSEDAQPRTDACGRIHIPIG
jgi:hypothetical protein